MWQEHFLLHEKTKEFGANCAYTHYSHMVSLHVQIFFVLYIIYANSIYMPSKELKVFKKKPQFNKRKSERKIEENS